jgi:regulator of replication initiation timing
MDYCSGDSLSDDDSSDNEDDDAYMVTGITRHFQSNEETLFNESDKKRIFAFTRKGAAEGSEELAAIVALEGQLTGLAEDVSHTKKSLDTVMREKEELLTQLQQLRMKHDNMLNKHNIADEDDDDEHKEVFLSPRGLNHAVIHDHGDNSDGVQVRRNPMRTGHWISPPPSARSGGKSSAWARAPGTSPPLSARSIGKVRDFPHHNPNPKPMRSPRTGSAKSFSASSSGNSPKGQSPKEAKWSSEKGVETRKVIRAIGTHIDDVHEELGLGADSFKHVPSPAEDRDDKL